MKLEHSVYARLMINGQLIQIYEPAKMSACFPQMIQGIINHEIETRDFSSLSIQISKRPIIDKQDEFAPLLAKAQEANDSDTIDGFPDLTWKDFMDLSEECAIFNNMRQLNQNAIKYSILEQQAITEQFDDKYHDTKWWALFVK